MQKIKSFCLGGIFHLTCYNWILHDYYLRAHRLADPYKLWEVTNVLTLSLLEATFIIADNICKQIGTIAGRQNVGPDLDPNCLTL